MKSFWVNLTAILSLIGIGTLIGIVLKYLFDRKENQKSMLFNSRLKAYSGLVGRLFNFFHETNNKQLKDSLSTEKINQMLSEPYLLGSEKLDNC